MRYYVAAATTGHGTPAVVHPTICAMIEAEIQAISPELFLQPRRYKRNTHFARGELPRIAMDLLRTTPGPISVREIAVAALARKGVTLPDRRGMKLTRVRLAQMFGVWAKRVLVESRERFGAAVDWAIRR